MNLTNGLCVENKTIHREPSKPEMKSRVVVLLLFCFIALQPLSTDLYLPSMPTIVRDLSAGNSEVQLTLSLFVAGFAIAQLIVGPVTDRFGRWSGAMGGCLAYVIGALLCATASNTTALVIGRIIQGLAVGAVVVSGRSIFRDSFEPIEGAKVLAKVYSYIGLVPFFAPLVGSLLLTYLGWRAGFWFLATAGVGITLFALVTLKETNQFKNSKALNFGPIFKNYWMVFKDGTFQSFTASIGGSFSGLFCFLSGSSFVLIDLMKLSPLQYSLCFSSVCVGYMVGTQMAARSLAKRGISGTARLGTYFHLVGGYSMLLLSLGSSHFTWLVHPAALLIPMFIYLIGHGMLQPCCQSGAIGPFPKNAGAASAMMGFLMNVLAAFAGFVLAKSFDGTTTPMSLGVALGATLAALCAHKFIR
jgi:MFS transporter, DHA1 family, multidrug resistance protein